MANLSHIFGEDLQLSPTGGLAISTGTQQTQERVIRRLLTNPGDYLDHLNYGAGLRKMVGDVVNVGQITAVIRDQMELEDAVETNPMPKVAVAVNSNEVFATITFQDKVTGEQSRISNIQVGE